MEQYEIQKAQLAEAVRRLEEAHRLIHDLTLANGYLRTAQSDLEGQRRQMIEDIAVYLERDCVCRFNAESHGIHRDIMAICANYLAACLREKNDLRR